jgi:hypothetical protein
LTAALRNNYFARQTKSDAWPPVIPSQMVAGGHFLWHLL